jgi:methionyl-tRNA formyltransferase
MSKQLRVIYAGTPEFAVPALQALIDSDHEVVAVYTQPDRPAGRGRKLRASPVKELALRCEIPVEQPASLKNAEAQQQLTDYQADVMIVAAYGLILPQAVLDTPSMGCINIHGSLLPRWRGAAPIHRAILDGDTETGVTIMQMNAGLDTGDMLLKKQVPITNQSTTAEIHDQLAEVGAQALVETLDGLTSGTITPEKQDDSLANYAEKLSKDEAKIDWSRSATEISRQVRAFNPWPVAQTPYEGQNIRIWMAHAIEGNSPATPGTAVAESNEGIDIATGSGLLRVTQLQMPGGKPMSVQDFLNGRSLLNQQLGQD